MPIVEAVMAAASVKDRMGREDKRLSKRIEDAMSAAVLEAYSKGITEPVQVKAMMMAARERVLTEAANVATARL